MKYALGLALAIGLFTFSSSAFPHYNALACLDATIGTSFAPKVEPKNTVAAPAAVLLSWNTWGNAGTETTEPSAFNDTNLSAANLTFGAGVNPATNGNRFGGSAWFDTGDTAFTTLPNESITGNDYIQFIVQPNAGYAVTFTSFQFRWDRSGTGPTSVSLRSSADNFSTDLGSVTGLAPSAFVLNTINIAGLSNITGPTTFRLYGYGGDGTTGTGGFDSNGAATGANVILNGTVALQPVPGTIGFAPTTYEQFEDSGTVTVSVARSDGSDGEVSVNYAEASSTLTKAAAKAGIACGPGQDYIVPSGTLTWADGDTADKTFIVTLCPDTEVEGDAGVQISLSDYTGGATATPGGTQAIVTILNDDASVQFGEPEVTEDESQSLTLTVTRAGYTEDGSAVEYAITPGTATSGTDCSGSADYAAVASGTLTFAADDLEETLVIPICADVLADADETFTITLSSPTNAELGGVPSTTATIRDTASQHRFTASIDPTTNYPATLNVASGPSNVGSVRVTLYDMFYEGDASNIDVLLVGPGGQQMILMADASAGNQLLTPTTLTFSDQAGQVLPEFDPLSSGTFEPTSYGAAETNFDAPAPAGPYNDPGSAIDGTASLSSVFGGTSAVGDWQLFIRSDAGAGFQRMGGGVPTIAGGWGLQLLAPSAAPATISGRVMDARGRAIGGAFVTVQGVDGTARRFMTNTFGYYRFEGLAAGATYVVSVSARRHSFAEASRVVSLDDNVGELNFVAQ